MKKLDDLSLGSYVHGAVSRSLPEEKSVGKIAVASNEKSITEPRRIQNGPKLFLSYSSTGKESSSKRSIIPLKMPEEIAAGRSGKSALDSLRFDEKGGLTGGVETPSEGRAGEDLEVQCSDFLTSKGITVVVAEQFGYEIVRAMKERGIACVEFKGSAIDAVKRR